MAHPPVRLWRRCPARVSESRAAAAWSWGRPAAAAVIGISTVMAGSARRARYTCSSAGSEKGGVDEVVMVASMPE